MSKQNKGFYPPNETTEKARQPKLEAVLATLPQARLTTPESYPEHRYHDFEAAVAAHVAAAKGPVFTTDADPEKLWDAYLSGIPEEYRQHYQCNHCRRFVQRYGGLVTLDAAANKVPVCWPKGLEGIPPFFDRSVFALCGLVMKARINGVFLWGAAERVWGTPRNAPPAGPSQGLTWTHLHGVAPECPAKWAGTLTAEQAMAERQQDYIMLCHALRDFNADAARQAVRVLEADVVDRSEKALEIGRWFLALHERFGRTAEALRLNVVWEAVAAAPPGWCHVRSSMIGTLLEDIVAGLEFEVIKRRWNKKMHPLQYLRPTAAPSDGQIKAAEKLFERPEVARALERRYAVLDDVLKALWVHPAPEPPPEAPQGGPFDHLKQGAGKKVKPVELPPRRLSWTKFRAEVLANGGPAAMEALAPVQGPYYGLVGAVHKDAAPIIQWDGLTEQVDPDENIRETLPRNPVNWYFWHGGSSAHQWSLDAGTWVRVNMVFLPPHQWQRPEHFAHQPKIAFFALEGAVDRKNADLALFPEVLKNEYRGARAVIEAHSKSKKLAGADAEGQANGIALQPTNWGAVQQPLTVRVRAKGGTTWDTYTIDRWE